MSVGYWQASRIQALLGHAAEASRQAEVCLSYSHDLEPFYLGYAHEARARAAQLAGDAIKAAEYVALARGQAARVADADHQSMLLKDLEALATGERNET